MKSKKNKFRVLPGLALAWALACDISVSHAERADSKQPVHLEAAQVSIDDANQISTFKGNVLLTQGTMSIRGDKIVVTQSKDGLQRGTATGKPASFRQKREGFDEFVEGYAERIEYDSSTTTVDLFGQARMKRGQDEVRGEHISYNSRTEVFQALSASGKGAAFTDRVRVTIQPKNDPALDTPVPDQPTNTSIEPENKQ